MSSGPPELGLPANTALLQMKPSLSAMQWHFEENHPEKKHVCRNRRAWGWAEDTTEAITPVVQQHPTLGHSMDDDKSNHPEDCPGQVVTAKESSTHSLERLNIVQNPTKCT